MPCATRRRTACAQCRRLRRRTIRRAKHVGGARLARLEFQAHAGANAGRVQLDVVRQAELKILDFAAQEDVAGEGVIDAEAGGEAENIFAVTSIALVVGGADRDKYRLS